MLDLTYRKTKGNWPAKAAGTGFTLNFSGSFQSNRIRSENLHVLLEAATEVILWLLMILGILAFGLGAYTNLQDKQWLFFLQRSPFTLIFWVCAFTTAYLWARRKQRTLKEEAVNLLHWDERTSLGKNLDLDVYDLFNQEAKRCWNNAHKLARSRKKDLAKLTKIPQQETDESSVSAVDLFLSLLDNSSVQLIFWRLGVNTQDIKVLLKNYALLNPAVAKDELEKIPFTAFAESLKLHNKSVDPLMLVCALSLVLPQEHIIQSVFFNLNVTLEELEIISSWIFNLKLMRQELQLFHKMARFKPDREINKGLTSVPTYYLDHYSTDLTWMAKHGGLPLAWGRQGELREIFALLAQGKTNLVIKGPEGSGRTATVNELAYKMVTEQVPKALQDKRLVRLEISAILGNPQKAESIFIKALNEAYKAGNIVLVIEDIHTLSRAITTTGLSLLELLVNFSQGCNLSIIGTSTIADYTENLRNAAGFEETFASYELRELGREGVLLACCVKASLLELKDRCFFRYQAIQKAVELSDLYVKNLSQPQKAISILVEASSRVRNETVKVVAEELIDKIVSEKTHIPTQALSENEAEKLLDLEEALSKYVVGQRQAVVAVAEGLRRARSGLASGSRPLASFLFLGPTGVGKTEVARTLSKVYFGEEDSRGSGEKFLLRLDMSEYRGSEGLAKLLGTENSKIDTPLAKHLKNYPFCLLLLDEFEKASSEILNVFLQILEDGRLTSAKGEVLDLSHVLIIATSNAGTLEIQNGLKAGKTLEQIKLELFNQLLLQTFPPELLNRFDGIILFSPLSPDEVKQITQLQLQMLQSQLRDKGIKIDFTETVVQDIATKAFDPLLGARPIRRYIQDHIEGFIAKLILSKQAMRGTELTVDMKDGNLILK